MAFDEEATAPAAERGEGNQEEKTPVPPTIEEVRDRNHKEVLCPHTPLKHKPIEQEHSRQKQGELYRIEKHNWIRIWAEK